MTSGASRAGWLAGLLLLAGTGVRAQEAAAAPGGHERAIAAGRYLCRSLEPNGYFVYNVDPVTGVRLAEYNWLRHAGTIVALCQLYGKTNDDAYRQAARQAAVALESQIRPVRLGARTFTALVDDPAVTHTEQAGGVAVKAGGCALAVVALLKLDDVCQQRANKEVARQLCEYLRASQKPNGEPQSKLNVASGTFGDFRSDYYPGEALVAMAMTEARYPEPANRQAMLRLLTFLVGKWEWASASATRGRYVPFDHWGMIGLSQVYDLVTEDDLANIHGPQPVTRQRLLELAVRLCEIELKEQQLRGANDPNAGSFRSNAGECTPTAIRVEGITAIANLLKRQPDPRWPAVATTWADGIALAREFLGRCQYTADDIQALGLKADVTGGFRRNRDPRQPTGSAVQIDYCQHAMSALLEW